MSWNLLTPEIALEWDERLWEVLVVVWLVLWFGMKTAKKREQWSERAPHLFLVVLGSWLVFSREMPWEWLNYRLLPNPPLLIEIGLALTALGVGMAVWARLSLGSNWSGTVTLKHDHELVSKGLYRWIRHPIYTGVLLGMAGTAMIGGLLRGWIGIGIVLLAFYLKARKEESFLREEFGAGFEEHSRRTGMFLPKWT